MGIVEWLNEYSGFSTVALTFVLAGITLWYALLTKGILKSSAKSVEYMHKTFHEDQQKQEDIKYNYLYLINEEIAMNQQMYTMVLENFMSKKERKPLNNLKFHLEVKTAFVDQYLKKFMIQFTNSTTWDKVNSDCIKYLPKELVQELVGYYAGVHTSKIYSATGMGNKEYIKFIEGQLESTQKCYELIEQQGVVLRRLKVIDS